MKIISYNVNGIRAAMSKGLIEWIQIENPDVMCFQEIKADEKDIDTKAFEAIGYDCHWFSASKKGYSGVGIISKKKLNAVTKGCGIKEYDDEGRIIYTPIDDFILINTYFPSGTSGEERQDVKYKFLEDYLSFVEKLKSENPNIIVCGDYNIAHTEIDIHDPKGNKKSSGFLPEEREWMTRWFQSGFVDTYRKINPNTKDKYSWWTFRFGARSRNKGWRIDYFSASQSLENRIAHADILDHVVHSDHCPILLEVK